MDDGNRAGRGRVAWASAFWLAALPAAFMGIWLAVLPATKAGNAALAPTIHALEPMVANVAGTRGEWTLRLQIHLEMANGLNRCEVYEASPRLRDRIGGAMARQTLDELEGPDGRERLRGEVMAAANAVLAREGMPAPVADVYFTEFLIGACRP